MGSTHSFGIGASCRRRQDKLQQTAAGLQVLHEIKSKMITSKETVVKILEQLTTIKRMKFVEKIFSFPSRVKIGNCYTARPSFLVENRRKVEFAVS